MLTFEGEDRGSVDIFGSVVSLRNQRCNMVQTPVSLFPDHITFVYTSNTFLHSYCINYTLNQHLPKYRMVTYLSELIPKPTNVWLKLYLLTSISTYISNHMY